MSTAVKYGPGDDLAYLRDDNAWVNWPVQTVKKRKADHSMPDCGLVSPGCRVVYDANLWGLPQDENGIVKPISTWPIKATYESVEAMLADGWEVD